MLAFLLFTSTISSTSSLECHDYLDSPLIPSVLDSNNTCTGSYCYRIESKIVHDSFESNQQAVLMGCFEYPLPTLTLGCRRNFEESVLCVCQSADFCNGDPSSDVRDLPIVRDCRNQYMLDDGKPDDGRTCTSHYCLTYRSAIAPSFTGPQQWSTFACQSKENTPALERFDVFVGGYGEGVIPAGVCMKFQDEIQYLSEICSCTSRDCSTPSYNPGESGLPLDTRTDGMIECAAPSTFGGMRSCFGHQCFIMKQDNFHEYYGCIVYDERHMDKKFMLGTQQPLRSQAFYICDTHMCNSNTDPKRVFSGIKDILVTVNESCTCLRSSEILAVDLPQDVTDLTLILSISIPAALLLFLIAIVVGYRIFKKQWPLSFLCEKTNGRVGQKPTVINVTSAGPLEKKKKLY